jgi:hypothetical protein
MTLLSSSPAQVRTIRARVAIFLRRVGSHQPVGSQMPGVSQPSWVAVFGFL